MAYYGQGYCDDGFYVGRDGQGEAGEDDCKALCMREPQCTFANYMNDGSRVTCSRYYQSACRLVRKESIDWKHKTFFKKGLLSFVISTFEKFYGINC